MDHGFDSSRPWVAVLPEPSAPAPQGRVQHVGRLCVQVKGLSVAQFPNPPLAVRIAATVVALRSSGTVREVAKAVALIAGAIWAYQELTAGTNWFRRLIGAATLAQTVAELMKAAGKGEQPVQPGA